MISKRERNNITAKMDMLDAVKAALIKHGFAKLGINLVAEEANIDKSAIYRYFGNFEGLLSAYIDKQDYWLQSIQLYTPKDNITKELAKKIIREQFDALYYNEELQELIRWEIAERGIVSAPITVKREIYSQGILDESRKILDNCGINFNFLLSIIFGGIYYIILHKEKGPFCEVDIMQKKQKDELLKSLDWLMDLLFETNENKNKIRQAAINANKKGISNIDIAEIFDVSIDEVEKMLE